MKTLPLFPCTIVGSYPQPDWLIDRQKLSGRFPPRTRARELWRVAPEFLEEAQRDATRIAIQDQERAGLDIITDGEVCRESYSNHFATALDGLDLDNPGEALDRSGEPVYVPRIVGPIRRRHLPDRQAGELRLGHFQQQRFSFEHTVGRHRLAAGLAGDVQRKRGDGTEVA